MSDGPNVTVKPRPFSGISKLGLGLLSFGTGPTQAEIDEWFRKTDARLDQAEAHMDVLLKRQAHNRAG